MAEWPASGGCCRWHGDEEGGVSHWLSGGSRWPAAAPGLGWPPARIPSPSVGSPRFLHLGSPRPAACGAPTLVTGAKHTYNHTLAV